MGITGSVVSSDSILLSINTICHLLLKATINILLMTDLLLIKVIFSHFCLCWEFNPCLTNQPIK